MTDFFSLLLSSLFATLKESNYSAVCYALQRFTSKKRLIMIIIIIGRRKQVPLLERTKYTLGHLT